ncbi:hypothetical protein BKA70DRAFT_1238226 [Coprinopsis sp. MPI-PUGE-AT-0042]|nr:hypothetical protein BKA70DRAFT_1238226 [Coprinopsis sp. MPI-PUGE-AT-0042]
MTEFCSQQATSGTPAVDVFQRSLVFSGFPFLLVPHSNHRSSIPHFIACLRVERTMQCHHLRPPGPLPAMRIETSNLIIATSYLNAANTHALPLMATTNNDSPAIFKFADATEDLVWLRCKAVTKFLADVTMTSGQREAASKRPPLRPGLGGGRGPASVRISTDANDIKVKLYTHCLGLGSMVPISRLPSFSTEHMRSRVSVDDSGNVCAKLSMGSRQTQEILAVMPDQMSVNCSDIRRRAPLKEQDAVLRVAAKRAVISKHSGLVVSGNKCPSKSWLSFFQVTCRKR